MKRKHSQFYYKILKTSIFQVPIFLCLSLHQDDKKNIGYPMLRTLTYVFKSMNCFAAAPQ